MDKWRLLDTGLGSAARNIALTRALTEARNADEIPGTLRFLRYAPSALLGSRQSARDELDIARCDAERVEIQRRVSAGSVWLPDERHLGWELYLHRRETGRDDMRSLRRRVAHAVATALSALGVDARVRSSDEIEIDGRTVGVVAGAADGEALLVHGLVYMDADTERYVRLARVALAYAGDGALAEARARRVSLREVLGRVEAARVKANVAEAFESEFDMELTEGDLTLSDEARFARALRETQTPDWIGLGSVGDSGMAFLDATHAFAHGRLRAVVKYEAATETIRDVWFSGDVGLEPPRLTCDLEAALRDTPKALVERRVEWFFGSRPCVHKAAQPADFIAAVTRAVGRPLAASS